MFDIFENGSLVALEYKTEIKSGEATGYIIRNNDESISIKMKNGKILEMKKDYIVMIYEIEDESSSIIIDESQKIDEDEGNYLQEEINDDVQDDLPELDINVFNENMYDLINAEKYTEAEILLKNSEKGYNNLIIEQWIKKIQTIKNNKDKYSHLKLSKENPHLSTAKRAEFIYEDNDYAEYHYNLSIEKNEPMFREAIPAYLILLSKKDIDKAVNYIYIYKKYFEVPQEISDKERKQAVKREIAYFSTMLSVLEKSENTEKLLNHIDFYINYIENNYLKYEYNNNLKDLYYKKGIIYFEDIKNYSEAVSFFKKAEKIGADALKCNLYLGFCYIFLSMFEEAYDVLEINISKFGDFNSFELQSEIEKLKTESNLNEVKNEELLKKYYKKESQNDNVFEKYTTFFLEKSSFYGLSEEKIRDKNFTLSDIQNLIQNKSNVMFNEQAEIYLTASAIQRYIDKEDTLLINEYLSKYFNYKGNYFFVSNKLDSAISNYLMALSNLDNSGNKFIILKLLYLINGDINGLTAFIRKESENESHLNSNEQFYNNEIETNLQDAFKNKTSLKKVILMILSSSVGRDKIKSVLNTNKYFYKIFISKMNEKVLIKTDNINMIYINIFQAYKPDFEMLESVFSEALKCSIYEYPHENFKKLEENILIFDQDMIYLNMLSDIYEKILEIKNYSDYENKYQSINLVKNKINQLKNSVDESPTIFSIIYIYELIIHLADQIEKEVLIIEDIYKPKLKIEIKETDFIQTPGDKMNIPVSISNEENYALARNVFVSLYDMQNTRISEIIPFGNIKGGGSSGKEIIIPAHENDFSIKVKAEYITVNSETPEMIEKEFQISINNETEFIKIKNPYRAGEPVEDSNMFFGRDQLLEELEDTLIMNKNRCIVLYGQKRTGKSSVFLQLKKRLKNRYIILHFTIGSGVCNIESFYKTVKNNLLEYLEDNNVDSDLIDAIESEKIESLTDFIKFMKKSRKMINKYNNDEKEILLMIDEFTYLYRYIKEGVVNRNFMDSWKAMIEESIFKSALIGQDTMHDFISEFSNQFQVAKLIRIPYLDEESCEKLIVEPIMINGSKSRYLENTSKLIYEFTSGQPTYTQMFCEELVNHMNQMKKNYITIAAIDVIKEKMLKTMNIDKFDNLIDCGDGSKENRKQVEKLLFYIAKSNSHEGWINTSDIKNIENTQSILETLKNRDVIEYDSGKCRIKIPMFKEWLHRNYIEVE